MTGGTRCTLQRAAAPLLLVILAATASAQSIWTAADKPHENVSDLRCRGGAGFEFTSLGIRQYPSGQARVAIALRFAPGADAAGSKGDGLEPGSCAWVGRALAPTEPREVHFITAMFYHHGRGPIDTSASAAEQFTDVQSMAAYLKYPDHYWTFMAFDTGQGHFDTTTHGYWTDLAARAQQRVQYKEELPHNTSRWRVRAAIGGGMDGRRAHVTLDADGNLHASHSEGDVRCTAKVSRNSVQGIAAVIARSRPEAWKKSYAPKDNPDGCCDLIGSSLHLEREDPEKKRTTFETRWFHPTKPKVPEGIAALFDTVWEARKVCAFPM